jgi:hypothetical protein
VRATRTAGRQDPKAGEGLIADKEVRVQAPA